ncbi:MAG: energy-coupling factor transporter transmembrane protein EcfT [Gemmobacter sp.]|uniref:energy-coupling factor transporter transmembrane component T n=1 Tax=Gemmobacter sp. TaxID=1898957 RepID=UPI001A394F95|nr:energy-coupling factor transporter transmembrane component T [Gemmobacter sp.]MBL8561425.1 energy-coupling factor transporter transmembrane protein EcfT [Gemmobacter sp.]
MLTQISAIETPLHHWPAGLKLGLMVAGSLALFTLQGWALALAATGVAAVYLSQGPRFSLEGLRLLRPLWPFLLLLAVWHLWLWQPLHGAQIALRLIAAVGLANLVALTTRLEAMLALIERLLSPLRWLGLNPRLPALAMALLLRFVPVLLDKAGLLMQAWRARSPRRVGARIVLPLALAALDDADHVAEALRARGGL